MKRRDFVKMIEADGWVLLRHGARHDVYALDAERFPVPRHSPVKDGIVKAYNKKMKEIGKK